MWRASNEMGLPWVLLRRGLGAVEKLWCPFCGIFQGIRAVSGGYTNCGLPGEGGREGGSRGGCVEQKKWMRQIKAVRSRSFARSSPGTFPVSFLRPYRLRLLFNPALWLAIVPGRTDVEPKS